MTPGKIDPDNPGWQWVESAQGLGGWVPIDIVQNGEILADFDTRELSVNAGDRLDILDRRLGWSFARNVAGQTGWIPSSHLEP